MAKTQEIVPSGKPVEGTVLTRSNIIINARFTASLNETKVLLLAMSKVQKTGSGTVTFKAAELRKALGIADSSKAYSILKKCAVNISKHSIILESPKRRSFAVLNVAPTCVYEKGTFMIKLNDDILPYITNLTSFYTDVELDIMMSFGVGEIGNRNTNYALRLYDILKTQKYRLKKGKDESQVIYDLDALKITIGIVNLNDRVVLDSIFDDISTGTLKPGSSVGGKYSRWNNFKAKVIDPAIEEINAKTDISVRYETYCEGAGGRGGSVKQIYFYVSGNEAYKDYLEAEKKRQEEESYAKALQELDALISEPLSDEAKKNIIDAADGDISRVKEAYRLAGKQTTKIRSLEKWMVSAIKGGWKDTPAVPKQPKKKAGTAGPQKNAFNRFEQNEYDFDELEKEILGN